MAGVAAASRAWAGPAVLSYGFRPFFLLGAGWVVVAMALWVGWLTGLPVPDFPLAPVDWHVHALLFGYVPAVLAGFLLTAVPNWTGRLPVVGWPLGALAAIWIAGRIVTTLPTGLPPAAMAAVDLAFLLALAALIGREIVAGRNWRNLKVLLPLSLVLLGQGLFHLDSASGAAAGGIGTRLGIAAVIFLILLIGGRIVPSFTRNWLVRQAPGPLPAPFGRVDMAALALAGAALLTWVALPASLPGAVLAVLAGIATLIRLARWQGHRTLTEPLVGVLHLGYLLAALGFLMIAVAQVAPGFVAVSAALHLWTAGAIGLMTLAVMTRATLGHTGQALVAGPATVAIYLMVLIGALTRIAGPVLPGLRLVELGGLIWTAAFALFVVAYGPLLLRSRSGRG